MTWGNKTNIKVTLGGFIEAATIYRSRDEFSDVGSSFGTIPFKDIATSRTSEFHETARQSRLSLLAEGDFDKNTLLAAYFETDFLGASTLSNNGESNSYVLRIRHLYTTVDKPDWHIHFLAGQTWSMATAFKEGLTTGTQYTRLPSTHSTFPGSPGGATRRCASSPT